MLLFFAGDLGKKGVKVFFLGGGGGGGVYALNELIHNIYLAKMCN